MRIVSGGRIAHLAYCSNVHPGRSWDGHFAELREHVPAVRDALLRRRGESVEAFGIGLRLSARALVELEEAAAFERFRAWLDDEGCEVFTVNGFPYGAFHGEPVKADVYRPDWSEPARLDYTCRLATLLARLGPPEDYGTISTLPGTFKAWTNPDREARIAENLLRAVAHCMALEREVGVRIALALEPEPCCLFETAEETARYFEDRLLAREGVERLASLSGSTAHTARRALHRHLGVCHDVCHSAVEFEAPGEAFARYAASGIAVTKLQLSSALRLPAVDAATLERLAPFDEPVYLHQVVERDGTGLRRHADLGAAMEAARRREAERGGGHDDTVPPEWRVHFHVPVFLAEAGPFATTRETLVETLALQRAGGISRHLEVETYTWEVLPAALRDVPIAESIARELGWVRARL